MNWPTPALLAVLAATAWAQGDYLVIIGGGFHPKEIEIFHPDTLHQEVLKEPQLDGNGRMYHVSAQINETHVLVAGGRDPVSKQRLSSASIIDLQNRKLIRIGDTAEQRSGAAAASLYGDIYICGGLEGKQDRRCATDKCEKWDGREWRYTAQLRQNRAIFAMASLRGKVYAIGGEVNAGPCDTADAYSVLNTVEAYDPKSDRWDNVAPLINRRYAHSAAVYKDNIWTCGGHFDQNYETERTSGCESYDPDKNEWKIQQATFKPRAGLSLLSMNDILYAVGGAAIPLANKWFDYDHTPYTLEQYKEEDKSWQLHSELLQKRAYGASLSSIQAHMAPRPRPEALSAAPALTAPILLLLVSAAALL